MARKSDQSRKLARRVEYGRLVYYQQAANIQFWDQYWNRQRIDRAYRFARRGQFLDSEQAFMKYLPREGRIIEAGCGLGQIVLTLRLRGFNVEGVEWAAKTVAVVRRCLPELPIRVGDVTQLNVPDGYYAGYISLGVIEHRRDGTEPFLTEAFRVLKPGGVAMVSVPWFNPLRRWKAKRGMYNDPQEGLEFYQYAFTEEEFTLLLRGAGFEVIDCCPYGVYGGIGQEIGAVRSLNRIPLVARLVSRLSAPYLERCKPVRRRAANMCMMVCRKPGIPPSHAFPSETTDQ